MMIKMRTSLLLCVWLMATTVQGFVSPISTFKGHGLQSTVSKDETATNQGVLSEIQIESHADWMELLMDEEDDSITAVFFHASWCRFCKQFALQWKQQQRHYKANTTARAIKFASVEYGANRKLCQSLDIEHLPTVQFYHQDMLLHSTHCSPKELANLLEEKLERYLEMDPNELEAEAQEQEQVAKEGATTNSMELCHGDDCILSLAP